MKGRRMIVNVEGVVLCGEDVLLARRSEKEENLPGVLSLPGGKVELEAPRGGILEATLHREIREEVGISVEEQMFYLESKLFYACGVPVVDVVFLCRYRAGRAHPADPDEVGGIQRVKCQEAVKMEELKPWTRRSLRLALQMIKQT